MFQLLAGQQPQAILMRDYIATFKVLPLYDIETFYVCADSLAARGLDERRLLFWMSRACLLLRCANNSLTTTLF